jgi:hypothetical protein
VFGAYAGGGENVLTLQVGGAPQLLYGPATYVRRVAISGDGATVSYDVTPLNVSGDLNEVRVAAFTGGDSFLIATASGSGFSEPLDLSGDGAWLLDSPSGILYDTASGAARALAILTPGIDGHLALVGDGLPRGTLSGDGTRVLYVMHSGRCADCANQAEQLATLDIGDSNLGNAPEISGAKIDPTSVMIDGGSTTKATAKVAFSGKLVAFGIVALLDGRSEVNISTVSLRDDGTGGDTTAGDGLYSADGIRHILYVARGDDTGPRVLRIQAEVESSDGLHHAIAIDFATLDVVKA